MMNKLNSETEACPIDWQAIDTVLLDMDGTLLDLHFDNYFWLQYLPKRYAKHHRLSDEEAMAELEKSFVSLRGTLNWYCLDFWSDLTELPIAKLKQDIQEKIAFRPFVPEFLQSLKQMGKRRVIVTNAHRDSVDLKLRCTGLDRYVDRIISSHDYRYPKEEAAFWDCCQADEGFDRQRTVLIDDSISVLLSARRWGLTNLLAISAPDSQQASNHSSLKAAGLQAIDHFNELPWLTSA